MLNSETSNIIWNKLITPYFEKCNNAYGGLICPDTGYEVFCSHYKYLTDFAKTHYMAKNVVRLNRHKISAAIMIAILKAKFNEALAITVGLSILRAFILQRVDEAFQGDPVSLKTFEGVCKQDFKIFENGIPLTQKERAEWEWELYQVRLEGAYNLLAMAHILSDLENISRLKYFREHLDEEMIFPPYATYDIPEKDVSVDDISNKL